MALEGDLSEFQLTDIIQLIDLSKKTGGVYIEGRRPHEQLTGWLYFRDGKIVGAELNDLPPLDAAYTFFTLTSGSFRFNDDVRLDVPTITQSNEMIIMEGIMRQDAWMKLQAQVPSLSMIPRLVPNPAATGSEINLEADEWRVLTMVNGKNTVSQIAQRSGLGELRTCEIIARLLQSGLIEKRELDLAKTLFPEFDSIVVSALGTSARGILDESYTRVGLQDYSKATRDQVIAALDHFEAAALRMFGASRVYGLVNDMRAYVDQIFDSM